MGRSRLPVCWKNMLAAAIGLSVIAGCGLNGEQAGNRKLAEVYGQELYMADLEGMIPEGMSAEDSTLIIDAYINRWVRDAILLEEAERNIPENMDIDKLVADYRASLLLDNYKKALMEEALDSTITDEELTGFFEKHRESYRLETDIVEAFFMTLPRSAPDLEQVSRWWEDMSPEALIELRSFCGENGGICFLDEANWFTPADLASRWPDGNINERSFLNNRELEARDEDFLYFYYRRNQLSAGEEAPIEYVADQIERLILHQRKIRLVEETQDRMYERAMRNKDIKIY